MRSVVTYDLRGKYLGVLALVEQQGGTWQIRMNLDLDEIIKEREFSKVY